MLTGTVCVGYPAALPLMAYNQSESCIPPLSPVTHIYIISTYNINCQII